MGVLTLNVNILEVIVNNGKIVIDREKAADNKIKADSIHLCTSYDDIIKDLSTSYPQIEDNLCKRHKYWVFCGKIFDFLCV